MTLDEYLDAYDEAHRHPGNKITHVIGIPMIVTSIFLPIFNLAAWPWALGLFIVGWIFQFIGHAFEGNGPKFFQGPVYLLIGPLWIAIEILEFLRIYKRKRPQAAAESQ